MHVDAEIMKQAIEDSAELAVDGQASALPHPAVTNRNLHLHLGEVTFHPVATDIGADAGEGLRGLASRTKSLSSLSPIAQKDFNKSLVQLLHQFEHKTRRQEMEIQRLRAAVQRLEAKLNAGVQSE